MTSTRTLPARPDLTHLKLQAETLRSEFARGDPAARARVAALERPGRPPVGAQGALPLSLAQLILAREYGFASWPALKHEVESRRTRDKEQPMDIVTMNLARTTVPSTAPHSQDALAGLDAGTAALKAVRLDRTGSGYALKEAAWQERGAGFSLGAALRGFGRGSGMALKRVAMALAGTDASVRPVEVDVPTAEALTHAEADIIEQYLPVNAGESVIATQSLASPGLAPDRRRLMVAAGTAGAEEALRAAARDAGLDCTVVDLDGMALNNMFVVNYGSDSAWEGSVCLLNLGAAYATVILFTKGRYAFSRVLTLAGAAVAADPSGLAAEIKRCFDFYAMQIDPVPFTRGLLAGGFAGAPGFADRLGAALGIPFEIGDPFRAIATKGRTIPGRREAYAVAVGLALRRFDGAPASSSTGTSATSVALQEVPMSTPSLADRQDLFNFTFQLSSLQRSGVPILEGLEVSAQNVKNAEFKQAILEVRTRLREGQSLAAEFKRFPRFFDGTYIQMVAAGQETGKLDEMLDWLAAFIEKGDASQPLALYARQLAAMVKVGLPLTQALFIIAEQCSDARLQPAFRGVAEAVKGGASLAEAVAAQPAVFDGYFVSMVKAGDTGGNLDVILHRIAEQIERSAAFGKK